jgi:hypothetical protein
MVPWLPEIMELRIFARLTARETADVFPDGRKHGAKTVEPGRGLAPTRNTEIKLYGPVIFCTNLFINGIYIFVHRSHNYPDYSTLAPYRLGRSVRHWSTAPGCSQPRVRTGPRLFGRSEVP